MPPEPSFEIDLQGDATAGSRLLIGIANPGMVGLTVLDYLTTQTEAEQIGHVTPRGIPLVTPFADGAPRRPIRLSAAPDLDATLLVSELGVAPDVAERVADALLSFTDANGIDEITIVTAMPFPHGPDQHDAFLVGTDSSRDSHETAIEEGLSLLQNGFFDGVTGALIARRMDADTPAVGVLVTPAHPPGPDFDGSILVIEALESLYDVSIDTSELRERSEQMRRYYQRLAEQMEQSMDGGYGRTESGDDGMYM